MLKNNITNIIALPFAGGNQYSYNSFINSLPSNFALRTVEFPGRGDRLDERNLSDIRELANDVLGQIRKYISEFDYLIYGHSMGTLVGYELAKLITRLKLPRPSLLFFTGRAGPSIPEEDCISSFPTQAFWEEIDRLGGLPKEIMADKELLNFFEPFMRSDFKAVETYRFQPLIAPLPIPIHVIAGTLEKDVDLIKLDTWQQETIYPIEKSLMSGDHFFIFDHIPELTKKIVDAHQKRYIC